MITVRPRVAELCFQLYGRALHPELFHIHSTRTVRRGPFEAQVRITSAGHVVSWSYENLRLTEVAASTQHPLPQRRRLLFYRFKGLRGERGDRVQCRGGVTYQVNFEIEWAEPEIFWSFQQELARDGERQGMLARFDTDGRLALGAMSYIHLETRSKSLLVQAFHTFPDDYAIVRSQSLFEIP